MVDFCNCILWLTDISPRNCYDIYQRGDRYNGVYTVYLEFPMRSNRVERKVKVYCDMTTSGGGWTVCITSVHLHQAINDACYRATCRYYHTRCSDIHYSDWRCSIQYNTKFVKRHVAVASDWSHYHIFAKRWQNIRMHVWHAVFTDLRVVSYITLW